MDFSISSMICRYFINLLPLPTNLNAKTSQVWHTETLGVSATFSKIYFWEHFLKTVFMLFWRTKFYSKLKYKNSFLGWVYSSLKGYEKYKIFRLNLDVSDCFLKKPPQSKIHQRVFEKLENCFWFFKIENCFQVSFSYNGNKGINHMENYLAKHLFMWYRLCFKASGIVSAMSCCLMTGADDEAISTQKKHKQNLKEMGRALSSEISRVCVLWIGLMVI